MEIAEEKCGLRTCDDENNKDHKQEAKHIIRLVGPDAIKYEEELDEDATEGKDSTHQNSREGPSVQTLFRHLARDLIRSNWMFDRLKM